MTAELMINAQCIWTNLF